MTSVGLFELVLALLATAIVVSLVAGRIHLPPAAALVVGGMVLALTPGVPAFNLDPDLILVLFLPPLLMASAFFTVWRDFVAQLRPILFLSIGAVAFTTLVVAIAARLAAPALPWAACFALGAIVSPPDAVAAKAVLQGLALPRRLTTILEGESLVNDASGLVLYRFAVAAAMSGSFSAPRAGATFVWLVIGGVGVGLAFGYAVGALIRRLRDTDAIVITTFLATWVGYIAAERIGASGVLAIVTFGIVFGIVSHETFSASERTQTNAVWKSVVFVLEAFVFVLIGLSLRGVLERLGGDMAAFSTVLPMALAVAAAVVVSRFAWVFPATYAPRWLSPWLRRRDPSPPIAMPIIIGWAGMRGVVTLAAALALPLEFPGRDHIIFAAFFVILFTVLVQGPTLGPLIAALRVDGYTMPSDGMLELPAARVVVNEAALSSLQMMVAEDGTPLHPRLVGDYERRVLYTSRYRDARAEIEAHRRDYFAAALGAVASARGALIRLHLERKIHDSVLRTIEAELDLEELRLIRFDQPAV